MGRPATGALSTYPVGLRDRIRALREENEGWGAISILVELEEGYGYPAPGLPSETSVYLFLKEEGLIPKKEPKGILPVKNGNVPKKVHEQWEMDAEGANYVDGLGHHSMINIKDGLSKKHCMAFPVAVRNGSTQPCARHYKWGLRLAFGESGLPKRIQVDRDSVFIENSSRSPFPSRLHLWLLALGVGLCFIDRPPPAKNAVVERSHQTLHNQAVKGKRYRTWRGFFNNCNKRRERLNEKYPSRSHGKKAPLQAFPKAAHSKRHYDVAREHEMLVLGRVYRFLAKGKWHRKVSSSKAVMLGGQRYPLKGATPGSMVTITFCGRSKKLIFRCVNELEIARIPIKNITKGALMGAGTKALCSMKNRLLKARDFPLG